MKVLLAWHWLAFKGCFSDNALTELLSAGHSFSRESTHLSEDQQKDLVLSSMQESKLSKLSEAEISLHPVLEQVPSSHLRGAWVGQTEWVPTARKFLV